MKITLSVPVPGAPEVEVDLPGVPRVGEDVTHRDVSRVVGDVHWDADDGTVFVVLSPTREDLGR